MVKKKSARKTVTSGTHKATSKNTTKTKNSLVANINRRKKAGTSRSKEDSTISAEAYSNMERDWPKKKSRKKS